MKFRRDGERILLEFSAREVEKYGKGYKRLNHTNLHEVNHSLEDGIYNLKVNDIKITAEVRELEFDNFYRYNVSVDDNDFVIEGLKELTRFDLLRAIIRRSSPKSVEVGGGIG